MHHNTAASISMEGTCCRSQDTPDRRALLCASSTSHRQVVPIGAAFSFPSSPFPCACAHPCWLFAWHLFGRHVNKLIETSFCICKMRHTQGIGSHTGCFLHQRPSFAFACAYYSRSPCIPHHNTSAWGATYTPAHHNHRQRR